MKAFFAIQRLSLFRFATDYDCTELKKKTENKTQRIVIHYRFVGVIEKPVEKDSERIILEARQGVAVEYLTA